MNKNNIEKIILPTLKKYGIVKASLFGSFARNEKKTDSDIDLLIEFDVNETRSLLDLIALEQELSDILNRKVDVLTYDSIHPLLKNTIMNEQEIFHE